MIKESAIVVDVDGDRIVVEAAIKTTCSSCQAQSDCGSGVISRALSPKSQRLVLHSPIPCRVGDKVTIGVPEAGIITASMWLYVAPLMVFLLAAIGLDKGLPLLGLHNELWPIGGSIIFTIIGFFGISHHLKQQGTTKFQPVLLTSSTPLD
ncbi:SoxR reducing system RseC family protein [Alteromonas sp. C1M14]|uniref:SoxR reducing system RseC family protein n=1 Tax=Alteromonas sp. C1M14 TaxID=2841567 RepID=UPI001C099673|nr:SoxR reducing system RseC family protein [Alteromonas sp. C1M14]MBU2979083.1 SoxR reducing system RseC family protein [Alteromonas sp. C1M14]